MKSRFVFTPLQKAILWIGFLLTLWRFVQIPAVFDAILKFYAAGEIPGTNNIASPQLTLQVLCGFFATAALTIFFRLFIWPLFTRRRHRRLPPAPAARPQPVRPVVEPLLPMPQPVAVRQQLPRAAVHRRPAVIRPVVMVTRWLVRCSVASAALMRHMRHIGKALAIRSLQFVALLATASLALWAWFEPFARRFDSWLEHVVKSYGPTAKLADMAHTTLQAARTVHTKTQDLRSRMPTRSK